MEAATNRFPGGRVVHRYTENRPSYGSKSTEGVASSVSAVSCGGPWKRGMHAIQISHRCSDPDRRGHVSAAFESWLDSTARSALAPMVAAPARHRRCFDIRETIVVSIACIICRLAQSGRLAAALKCPAPCWLVCRPTFSQAGRRPAGG